MTKSHLISLGLGFTLLALSSARAVAADKSLYDRLGGEKAISAVVDDFVGRAATDPKVNFLRDGKISNVDVPKLKKHLVDLVGQLTGGPQKYTGGSMKDVHKGMKITDAEFDALAADLVASLDKFKVPAQEKGELLKMVASTRGDIVEVKGAGKKKARDKRKA